MHIASDSARLPECLPPAISPNNLSLPYGHFWGCFLQSDTDDCSLQWSGIFGLSSAATYHRLHPTASILILDEADSLGGTWSDDRLFPGLKTNNLLGMYEHPELPMSEVKLGVKKGQHIPGAEVQQYLKAFVHENGVEEFMRTNTKVEAVEKSEEGWTLHCTSNPAGRTFSIGTIKLIIAVGNTNKPKMPKYLTSASFEPTIIHSKEFPAHYEHIVKPGKHTLVVGGGKSAWDVAYACATQPDATVTLLIRPSGNGPNWMTPSHVTPFKLWLEKLVFTRFFGCRSTLYNCFVPYADL
jgi:cation diffusion facilitator CzcD-associated flavoprotein CzcO